MIFSEVNKMSFDNMPEMNQKIETGRHKHLMFKGKDGRDYSTAEALRQANEAWKRENLQYKGKDGRDYSTAEALRQANEAWKRENLFYIVYDAELGIREIAPRTGKVQVCVGHLIERDETGMRKYVPVYRTEESVYR